MVVETLAEITVRFGEILVAPLRQLDMLWIIIPIYINWILTDYYQERKGTDFGNAITNGFVALFVGIDWTRQIVKADSLVFDGAFLLKISISIIFILFGLLIMIESARAKKVAHYLGRVRVVSYFMIAVSPIYYGVVALDAITIAAILLFLPIWYAIGEIIDRSLPAPAGEEDTGMPDLKMPDLEPGAGMPSMKGLPPLK